VKQPNLPPTITIDELCRRTGLSFQDIEDQLNAAISEHPEWSADTDAVKLQQLLQSRKKSAFKVNIADVMKKAMVKSA
jgi:hypothetical protein